MHGSCGPVAGESLERGAVPQAGMQPAPVAKGLDVLGDSEPRAGAVGEVLLMVISFFSTPKKLSAAALPQHTPVRPMLGPGVVSGVERGERGRGVLGAPLSLWKVARGATWPWVMAIASASVTRLVRM